MYLRHKYSKCPEYQQLKKEYQEGCGLLEPWLEALLQVLNLYRNMLNLKFKRNDAKIIILIHRAKW